MIVFKILSPFNISQMDEATLFKFDKWIRYGKSNHKGKNYPQKGCGMGHVIVLGMKPRSVNFANASTMVSATPGVKNSSRNRLVSVT